MQLFVTNWEKLKGIQDRLERQKGGEGRDIPYLAALLLKRRTLSEFRILKSQKPPPPPLWAQVCVCVCERERESVCENVCVCVCVCESLCV